MPVPGLPGPVAAEQFYFYPGNLGPDSSLFHSAHIVGQGFRRILVGAGHEEEITFDLIGKAVRSLIYGMLGLENPYAPEPVD